MRLILIGPPGSGKGTQAKLLAERNRLCHFGTGDLLREAVRLGTAAGKEAAPYILKGGLVPDDLVNKMVAERMALSNCATRFVMDGYPRTRPQALAFEKILDGLFVELDAVVRLVVEDEEIVRRLSGRWACPHCHATYHVLTHPPRQEGVCDRDGQALVQREDDREEVVRERLRVYHATYEDLLAYYRDQRLLQQIPGTGSLDEVYQHILEAVAAGKGP